MKQLSKAQVIAWLKSMHTDYDVRVPIRLHDGTRSLGTFDEGPLALTGGTIPQKVTHLFFPQMESLLKSDAEPGAPSKPLAVIGFTAEDADCLAFIDRFYTESFFDDIYMAKRQDALVICLTGHCGPDGHFMRIAGDHCDLELIRDEQDHYLAVAYTVQGEAPLKTLQTGQPASQAQLDALKARSNALGCHDQTLLKKASQLLLQNKVPDSFWRAISDRCIACTSCNLVCPTCTCFDVFDRRTQQGSERWRIWDSCQLDGFMREASGHNPMAQESQRTRRRIHHKLCADVMRWGEITCKSCGRCDQVCPTGIGIKAVCCEMVDRYGMLLDEDTPC